MATHIVVPTHIYASSRGTFVNLKLYIVARMKFLPCIYFRRRQYVPNKVCRIYFRPTLYNVKQDNWVDYKYIQREREREGGGRERENNTFLLNLKYLNSMFVFIQM